MFSFVLLQSASPCTSVQRQPLHWGGGSQAFPSRPLLPVLVCRRGAVASRRLPPTGAKAATAKEENASFVLTFPAGMPRVSSRLTLCPVSLSVKWGSNAYLIRMLQKLSKSFGKCFRDGKCWHSARGPKFSCFRCLFSPPAPIQALNAQVSKNQLSFQWPEK